MVQQAILDDHPDAETFIVWLDILAFDSKKAAGKAQRHVAGGTAVHPFWDPEQLSGKAVARSLGWPEEEVAYDIYLFFDADAEWGAVAPLPADYRHQLTGRGEDGGRLVTGEELAGWLGETAARLLGEPTP